MKRILFTLMSSLFMTGLIFSQELNWGDFENDSSMWIPGGGSTAMVMDNPYPDGNSSSKVLMFEPTATWQGISHWFQDGVLDSTYKTISLDVYADSACNLQLSLINSVSGKVETFLKDTVIANGWRHIVFDISDLPTYDYQNIAFMNNEVVTYYFDNIKVSQDSMPIDTLPVDTVNGYSRFIVKNVIFGTVTDSMDFSANAMLKWDPDTLHMIFNVVDDSIVTEGTSYQVDNIEVYIDLDNSKRMHWPRNGGWVANDTTFDANDFQLRLIPGKEWTFTTENQKVGGVTYMPTIDSTGYSFHVAIPWDSLQDGFTPAVGQMIGFDVLISDNDATASDANRNQITYNSLSVNTFNDPSRWATLRFDSAGIFVAVPDTTAPAAPTNVAATVSGSNVNLSWNQVVNAGADQYIILQNSVAVDTIYALQTNNKYTVSNLQNGTYKFGVIAIDLYNNASDTVSADSVTIGTVDVKNPNLSGLRIYPVPADNYINISNLDGAVNVRIFNATGQLVMKLKVANNESINVSALHKGLYSVEVSNEKNVNVLKMIKR